MANKFHGRTNKRKSKKILTFTYRPLAFAIAIAVSGSLPSVTQAATFMVTSTADSGTGSLREAVGLANATVNDPDTIEFDTTQVSVGSTITLASELTVTDTLTISGPTAGDAGSIILDGNNITRHINGGGFSPSSGKSITLDNMTLQNGFFDGTLAAYGVGGGAVFVKNASLVLNNSKVSNNSTIGNNARGGGLSVENGSFTLNQSTLSSNSTTGSSARGGGLFFYGYRNPITINQSTILGNSTTGSNAHGGGLFISYASGDAMVTQTTVSGNSTSGSLAAGGGLYFYQSNAKINQSTISGNSTAANAGGIYFGFGTLTLTQSTVYANQSTVGAAGLWVYAAGVSLVNSILSGNSNIGNGSGNFQSNSVTVTATNSLFGDDQAEITDTANSSGNIFSNLPKLSPLQNNGGLTETHVPTSFSPAFNAGDNTSATAFSNDQRGAGFPRILQVVVDIGAVESQPFNVINTNDSGVGSLRQAVLDANAATGADNIIFDIPSGSLITLSSGALNITESVTISGPAQGDSGSIILDGNDSNQHIVADFTSTSGQTITLENITLQNGLYAGSSLGLDKGGGAIFVNNADLVINHGNITDNRTTGDFSGGGAIFVNNADLVVNHGNITDNLTTGEFAGGAGIRVYNGDLSLNQTTVSDNDSFHQSSQGGGIIIRNGDITMTESTISGNRAAQNNGGGIAVINGNTTIIQSTISGNTAGLKGGGVFTYAGFTNITQSSIVNNKTFSPSFSGRGLSVNMTNPAHGVTLTNTILSGNNSLSGGAIDNFHDNSVSPGALLTATNSLFGDSAAEITDTVNSSDNVINNSPDLGILQNNGGSTETHLPNSNSPALNVGDNAATSYTSDQRGTGFLRIREGVVDIGAVESQSGPFGVVNNNDSGVGSLRQAVLDANTAIGADSIDFGIPTGSIITLASELNITESVTISGPTVGDAGSIILDGNNTTPHIVANFPLNSGETITLENITLQNGNKGLVSSGNGGGSIFVYNADLIINHGNVSNNTSTGGTGGAIEIETGNVTLNHTTVSGNSASNPFLSFGGGVNVSDGDVTLLQSTVSNNSVTSNNVALGGGLLVVNGNLLLTQSTLSGNSISGYFTEGGGAYIQNGLTTLTQSTIVANTSTGGAAGISVGVQSPATGVILSNTILSGNSSGAVEGNFNNRSGSVQSFITAINSLFGDDAAEISDIAGSSANIFDNVPKLGPLQNNGGPTLTRLPHADSPALDAGAVTALTEDQRGDSVNFPRIINAVVDIGAVESVVLPDQGKVITRSEIVKPILQAALIEPMPPVTTAYGDVASNSFNANWIQTFKDLGFTEGCDLGNTNFCPNEVVTKEQLAKMIVKVKNINLSLNPYQGTYTDVPMTHLNALEIEAISAAGFSIGCGAGKYCPQEAVTHEIFYNILNAAFR